MSDDAKPYALVEAKALSQSHYGADPARVRATVEELEKAKEEAANWHAAFSQKAYPAESCRKERDDGNGGCGACSICCHELRQRAEKAEAELAEVQGIARESMARFDELHSMLKEAKAERDEARAERARLQDLHTRCAAFDDQPGPSCVTLAAKCAALREALAAAEEWNREVKSRQRALEVAIEERTSALAERNEARECEEGEREARLAAEVERDEARQKRDRAEALLAIAQADIARLREALVVAHQLAYDVQEWADDEHVFQWDDGDELVLDRAAEAERIASAALAETDSNGGKR